MLAPSEIIISADNRRYLPALINVYSAVMRHHRKEGLRKSRMSITIKIADARNSNRHFRIRNSHYYAIFMRLITPTAPIGKAACNMSYGKNGLSSYQAVPLASCHQCAAASAGNLAPAGSSVHHGAEPFATSSFRNAATGFYRRSLCGRRACWLILRLRRVTDLENAAATVFELRPRGRLLRVAAPCAERATLRRTQRARGARGCGPTGEAAGMRH